MTMQKIVVGVNGSAASNAALDWALQEAASRGAEIVAVHVVKPLRVRGGATVTDVRLRELDDLGDELRAHVRTELFSRLANTGVRHRIVVVEAHPATGILHVAESEDADLIVVGNGLHSTMEELFLGSVAHELSHKARRPFMVIPFAPHESSVDATGRDQRAMSGPRQTWAHRTGDQTHEVAARVHEPIL